MSTKPEHSKLPGFRLDDPMRTPLFMEIDLDDGVKANYPKFGKALAKVAGLS